MVLAACNRNRYTNIRRTESYQKVAARSAKQNLDDGFPLAEGQLTELINDAEYTDEERTYLQQTLRPICFKIVLDLLSQDPLPADPKEFLTGWLTRRIAERNGTIGKSKDDQPVPGPEAPGSNVAFADVLPPANETPGNGDLGGSPDVISRGNTAGVGNSLEPGTGDGAPILTNNNEEEVAGLLSRLNDAVEGASIWPSKLTAKPTLKDDLDATLMEAEGAKRRLKDLQTDLGPPKRLSQTGVEVKVVELTVDVGNLESKLARLVKDAEEASKPAVTFTLDTSDLDQSMSALRTISKDAEDVLKALEEKTPEDQHGVLKRGLKMGLSRSTTLEARVEEIPTRVASLGMDRPLDEKEELFKARATLEKVVKEAEEEASVEERNLFQLVDDGLKVLAALEDGTEDTAGLLDNSDKHRESTGSISSFDEASVKDLLRRRLLDLRYNQKQLAADAQAARDLLVAPGSVDALGSTADALQQTLSRAGSVEAKLQELSDRAQPLLFDTSQDDSLEISKRRQALGELTTSTSEVEDELGVVSGVLRRVMDEALMKVAQEQLHQGLTSLNDTMKSLDSAAEEARGMASSAETLPEQCSQKQPIKAQLAEALAEARKTLAVVDEATALGEAALQSADRLEVEDAIQTCQNVDGRAQLMEEQLKSVMADASVTLKRYGFWTPGYSGEEIRSQLQDLVAARTELEGLRQESKALGPSLEALAETRKLRDNLAKGSSAASNVIGKCRPLEATIQDTLARSSPDSPEHWGPLVQRSATILDQAAEAKAELAAAMDEARRLLESSELRTKAEALEALQAALQELTDKAEKLAPGLDDEDEVQLRQDLISLAREASGFDDTIQEALSEANSVLEDHQQSTSAPSASTSSALKAALNSTNNALEKGQQLVSRLTALTDEAKDMVKENEHEDVEELEGKLLDLHRQQRRMTNNMEAAEQKLIALRAQAQTNPDASKLEDDLEDRLAQAQAANEQLKAVTAQLEDVLNNDGGENPRGSMLSSSGMAELQHRLEDTSGDLEAADSSLQQLLNEASEALAPKQSGSVDKLGEDFEDRVYHLQKALKRVAPALSLVRNLMQALGQVGAEHPNCAKTRASLVDAIAEMQDKFDMAAETAGQAEDLLGSGTSADAEASMVQMDQPLQEADQDLSDLENDLGAVRSKAEAALRSSGLDVQQCLSEVKSPWDPVIKSQGTLRATTEEARALLDKVQALSGEDLTAAQSDQIPKSQQDLAALIKRSDKLDDKFNSLIETFKDDAHALIDDSDPETKEVLELLTKAHQELLTTDQRLKAAVEEAKALVESVNNPVDSKVEQAAKGIRQALKKLKDTTSTLSVTYKRGHRIMMYLQSIQVPTEEESGRLQDLTSKLAPCGDLKMASGLKDSQGRKMLSTLKTLGSYPGDVDQKVGEANGLKEAILHMAGLITQADSSLGEVRTGACFMIMKSLPNDPEDPLLRELHSAILNVKLHRCGLRDLPKEALSLLGELGQSSGMGFGSAGVQKGLSRSITELGHTETLLADIATTSDNFMKTLPAGKGRLPGKTADAQIALRLLRNTASITLSMEASLAQATNAAKTALKLASALSVVDGDIEDPLLQYLDDDEVADLYDDMLDSQQDLVAANSKLRGLCLRAVKAVLVLLQAPSEKATETTPLVTALTKALSEAGGAVEQTRDELDRFARFPDGEKEKTSKAARIAYLEGLEVSFEKAQEAVTSTQAKLEELLSRIEGAGEIAGLASGSANEKGDDEVAQVLESLSNVREELGEGIQTAQEWASHDSVSKEGKADLNKASSEATALENKLQLLEAKAAAADPAARKLLLQGLRAALEEGKKKERALTDAIQAARQEESTLYGSEAAGKLAAATEALKSGQNRLQNATKTASYTLGSWEDDPFASEHQSEARRLLSRIIAESGSVDMAAGGLVSKGQQLLLRLDKRRRSSAKPARAVKASSAAEGLTEVLDLAICLVASSVDGLQKASRGQDLTSTKHGEDEDDDDTPQAKLREGVLSVTEARSKLRGECMDALQRCAGIACLPVVLNDEKDLKVALLKVVQDAFIADEAASNMKGSAAVWLESLADAQLSKPQEEEAAKHVKKLNNHTQELLRLQRQLQLLLEGRGQEEDGKAVVEASTIEEADLIRAGSKLKRYTLEAQAWLEALQRDGGDGDESPEKKELKRRLQGIIDTSEGAEDKVKELSGRVKDLSEADAAAAPPVGNSTTRRSVFQKQKSVVQEVGEQEEYTMMYEEAAKEVDNTEDELRQLVGRAKSMLMLEPGVETWRDSLGECLVESMQDLKLLETAAQDARAWCDVLKDMRDVEDKSQLLASLETNLASAKSVKRRLDLLHAKAESLLANPNDTKALAAEAAEAEEAIELAGIDVNSTTAELQALLMEAHCTGNQACLCDEDLLKGELLRRMLDLELQQAKLKELPKEAMEVLATVNGGTSYLPVGSKKALSSGIAEAGTTEQTISDILEKAQRFNGALKPMDERSAAQQQTGQQLLQVLANARAVSTLTADNLQRASEEASAQSIDSSCELDDSLKEDLLASLGGLQQAESGLRGVSMVAIDTVVGVLTDGPQGPAANNYRKALVEATTEAGALQKRSQDTGVVARAFAGTLPEGDRGLSPALIESFEKVQASVDSKKAETLECKAKLEELIGRRADLGESEALGGEIRATAGALDQKVATLANAVREAKDWKTTLESNQDLNHAARKSVLAALDDALAAASQLESRLALHQARLKDGLRAIEDEGNGAGAEDLKANIQALEKEVEAKTSPLKAAIANAESLWKSRTMGLKGGLEDACQKLRATCSKLQGLAKTGNAALAPLVVDPFPTEAAAVAKGVLRQALAEAGGVQQEMEGAIASTGTLIQKLSEPSGGTPQERQQAEPLAQTLKALHQLGERTALALSDAAREASNVDEDEAEDEIKDGVRSSAADLRQAQSRLRGFTACALRRCASGLTGDQTAPEPNSDKFAALNKVSQEAEQADVGATTAAGPAEQLVQTMPTWPETDERQRQKEQEAAKAKQNALQALQEVRRVQRKLQTLLDPTYEAPPASELAERLRDAAEAMRASQAKLNETKREAKVWSELLDAQEAEMVEGPRRGLRTSLADLSKLARRQDLMEAKLGNALPYLGSIDGPPTPEDIEENAQLVEAIQKLTKDQDAARSNLEDLIGSAREAMSQATVDADKDPLKAQLREKLLDLRLETAKLDDLSKEAMSILATLSSDSNNTGLLAGAGLSAQRKKALSKGIAEAGNDVATLSEVIDKSEAFVAALGPVEGRSSKKTKDAQQLCRLLTNARVVASLARANLQQAISNARKGGSSSSLEDDDGDYASKEDLGEVLADLREQEAKLRGFVLEAIQKTVVMLSSEAPETQAEAELRLNLDDAIGQAGNAQGKSNNVGRKADELLSTLPETEANLSDALKQAAAAACEELERSTEELQAAQERLEALLRAYEAAQNDKALAARKQLEDASRRLEEASKALSLEVAEAKDLQRALLEEADDIEASEAVLAEVLKDLEEGLAEGQATEGKVPLLNAKCATALQALERDGEPREDHMNDASEAAAEVEGKLNQLRGKNEAAAAVSSKRKPRELTPLDALQARLKELCAAHRSLLSIMPEASAMLGEWKEDPLSADSQVAARQGLRRAIAESGAVGDAAGGIIGVTNQLIEEGQGSVADFNAAAEICGSTAKLVEDSIKNLKSSMERANRATVVGEDWGDDDDEEDDVGEEGVSNGTLNRQLADTRMAQSQLRGVTADALRQAADGVVAGKRASGEQEPLLPAITSIFALQDGALTTAGNADSFLESSGDWKESADQQATQTRAAASLNADLLKTKQDLAEARKSLLCLMDGDPGSEVIKKKSSSTAATAKRESAATANSGTNQKRGSLTTVTSGLTTVSASARPDLVLQESDLLDQKAEVDDLAEILRLMEEKGVKEACRLLLLDAMAVEETARAASQQAETFVLQAGEEEEESDAEPTVQPEVLDDMKKKSGDINKSADGLREMKKGLDGQFGTVSQGSDRMALAQELKPIVVKGRELGVQEDALREVLATAEREKLVADFGRSAVELGFAASELRGRTEEADRMLGELKKVSPEEAGQGKNKLENHKKNLTTLLQEAGKLEKKLGQFAKEARVVNGDPGDVSEELEADLRKTILKALTSADTQANTLRRATNAAERWLRAINDKGPEASDKDELRKLATTVQKAALNLNALETLARAIVQDLEDETTDEEPSKPLDESLEGFAKALEESMFLDKTDMDEIASALLISSELPKYVEYHKKVAQAISEAGLKGTELSEDSLEEAIEVTRDFIGLSAATRAKAEGVVQKANKAISAKGKDAISTSDRGAILAGLKQALLELRVASETLAWAIADAFAMTKEQKAPQAVQYESAVPALLEPKVVNLQAPSTTTEKKSEAPKTTATSKSKEDLQGLLNRLPGPICKAVCELTIDRRLGSATAYKIELYPEYLQYAKCSADSRSGFAPERLNLKDITAFEPLPASFDLKTKKGRVLSVAPTAADSARKQTQEFDRLLEELGTRLEALRNGEEEAPATRTSSRTQQSTPPTSQPPSSSGAPRSGNSVSNMNSNTNSNSNSAPSAPARSSTGSGSGGGVEASGPGGNKGKGAAQQQPQSQSPEEAAKAKKESQEALKNSLARLPTCICKANFDLTINRIATARYQVELWKSHIKYSKCAADRTAFAPDILKLTDVKGMEPHENGFDLRLDKGRLFAFRRAKEASEVAAAERLFEQLAELMEAHGISA